MFARVFDTAKRILSHTPSISGASGEVIEALPTAAPVADAAMVTTRGGTETPGAATPWSSVKKPAGKRELETLETPSRAKRQRKTASAPKKTDAEHVPATLPSQESSGDTSDTIAVAVPPSLIEKAVGTGSAKKGSLAIRRRSSPQVVVAKLSPPASTASASFEQGIQDDGSGLTPKSVHRTPKPRSGAKHSTPTPKAAGASSTAKGKTPKKSDTSASSTKQSGKSRKASHAEDTHTVELTKTTTRIIDEVPSSSYESEFAPILFEEASESTPQPNKVHKRFSSEEPADSTIVDIQPAELPEEINDDDDSASDSDEAPEVVTAAAATSKARASQAEAQRASLAQQQKEAAKRRAREELIAAQQAAKRERDEKKARKLARKQAKTAVKVDSDIEQVPVHYSGKIEAGLPALLPDSLLATLPDQRAPTPPPIRRGKTEEELRREKLNHHIKFLERSEKPIKDLKKGNLMVAVLGQHNKVLPPKMNNQSRNVRERWLKGRTVQRKKGAKGKVDSRKVERRQCRGGGFLRGED